MSRYIAAIDQGTTSSRCLILDSDSGTPVYTAQQEFPQYFPKPGWVEHDAEEIWDGVVDVIKQALDGAGLQVGDLAALGITNQRETTVLWERDTGKPVHRAIVWQDRRSADVCGRWETLWRGSAKNTGRTVSVP